MPMAEEGTDGRHQHHGALGEDRMPTPEFNQQGRADQAEGGAREPDDDKTPQVAGPRVARPEGPTPVGGEGQRDGHHMGGRHSPAIVQSSSHADRHREQVEPLRGPRDQEITHLRAL